MKLRLVRVFSAEGEVFCVQEIELRSPRHAKIIMTTFKLAPEIPPLVGYSFSEWQRSDTPTKEELSALAETPMAEIEQV